MTATNSETVATAVINQDERMPQHRTLQQTLAACLDRLQAVYDCNHEVMDADDIGELLTTIKDLEYYISKK